MGKKIDALQYVNKKFGHLTVIKPIDDQNGQNLVLTRCVCGKERAHRLRDLRCGVTTSCGCKGIIDRESHIGEKYDNLTIVAIRKDKKWNAVCKCDCGNEYVAPYNAILSGKYKSCGCSRKRKSTTCYSRERLYGIWSCIKSRCNNPNYHSYNLYGGRGIKMCPEWEHDYKAFRAWALENGFKEEGSRNEYTIDRIENNRGYSPDNCRIVPIGVQQLNKRTNRLIEYNGETHPVTEWIRLLGLNRDTVWYRVKKNMTPEQILYKGHLNNR